MSLSDLAAFETDEKRLRAGSAIQGGPPAETGDPQGLSSSAKMADVDMTEGIYEMIERIVHRRRFGIRVNQR